jgi:nucleoside-diphosphate-sugar epimerase
MAEKFNELGDKLVLLGRIANDREKERADYLRSLGLNVQETDLTNDDLSVYMNGVDAVIHLAAAQHEANKPESYFERVNVLGTRRLLDACSAGRVQRFIYGSTIGVFGDISGVDVQDDYPPAPDNHYGRTKLRAEKVVSEYRDRLDVSVVRISETYGPGDFRLLKLFSGIKNKLFFIIGAGKNFHQVIYVDDLIDGIREIMISDNAVGETVVLAGSEVMTTKEMCEHVSIAVGVPLRSIRLPLFPFLALAVIFEQTLGRIGIQPPLHRRRLDFFRKSLSFSSSNRNRLLTWRPSVSFSDGAVRTAAWYHEQSLLD